MSSDERVSEHGGFRVGDRVRLRESCLMEMRLRGVSPGYVERHSGPGLVEEIVVNRKHGWCSVRIRQESGLEHWGFPDDLEPAPRPRRRVRST